MEHTPHTLITGRIRDYPGHHPSWTPAQRDVADEILQDCVLAGVDQDLLVQPDPYADYEDFWEDAVRISAAYKACSDAGIPARISTNFDDLAEATKQNRRLGPIAVTEQTLGSHARDTQLSSPAFLQHAGRTITPVTLNFEKQTTNTDEADLIETLLTAASHGVERMVLKRTSLKAGVYLIELSPHLDRQELTDKLFNLLGWAAVHTEGRPGQFVLQEYVPMAWEMRHFIVDGDLVTSAGCIEEFTPLNAVVASDDGQPTVTKHSDLLREHRGTLGQLEPSPVIQRPLRAQIMRKFAAQVGREHGGTIVIDTAINADTGQPLVVEFNDLPNSGLYASDVWALYRALVTATNRGYNNFSTTPLSLFKE